MQQNTKNIYKTTPKDQDWVKTPCKIKIKDQKKRALSDSQRFQNEYQIITIKDMPSKSTRCTLACAHAPHHTLSFNHPVTLRFCAHSKARSKAKSQMYTRSLLLLPTRRSDTFNHGRLSLHLQGLQLSRFHQ